MRGEILRRALRNPTTRGYLSAPVIIAVFGGLLSLLDHPAAHHLNPVALAALPVWSALAIVFCNYHLAAGNWSVGRWVRRLFVTNLPLAGMYGYVASELAPFREVVTIVSVLSVGIPLLGLLTPATLFAWTGTYLATLTVWLVHASPAGWKAIDLELVALTGATLLFTFWMVRASGYSRQLQERVTKLLVQTRRDGRRLRDMNSELAEKNDSIQRELRLAQRLQQQMIPDERTFPRSQRLQIGSRYVALESVGGDLYDLIELDDGRMLCFIADISGHGVPAAMLMTMTKVSLHSHARDYRDPGDLLRAMNRDLFQFIGDSRYYLTAWVGFFDLTSGRLRYANAAHPDPLVLRKNSAVALPLPEAGDGFFIGVQPDFEFPDAEFRLAEGDRLVLYTDGVIENRDQAGRLFGEERFLAFLERGATRGPRELLDELLDELRRFRGSQAAQDDISILCLDYGALPAGSAHDPTRATGDPA